MVTMALRGLITKSVTTISAVKDNFCGKVMIRFRKIHRTDYLLAIIVSIVHYNLILNLGFQFKCEKQSWHLVHYDMYHIYIVLAVVCIITEGDLGRFLQTEMPTFELMKLYFSSLKTILKPKTVFLCTKSCISFYFRYKVST